VNWELDELGEFSLTLLFSCYMLQATRYMIHPNNYLFIQLLQKSKNSL